MFNEDVYVRRRSQLRKQVTSGLIILPGNDESPRNFADNPYPFRQDSCFSYFFGIDQPGLVGIIDADDGTECLFGDDPVLNEIVWTGPQLPLQEKCRQVGVAQTMATDRLVPGLEKAQRQGRTIHLLPQYRTDTILKLQRLLGLDSPQSVDQFISEILIRAVVAQRSVKVPEEIEQLESAVTITAEMHLTAMQRTHPGLYEYQVVGALEGVALSRGAHPAFPTLFTIHGETLHNHYHGNLMQAGDIVVNDSGAESRLHYAGDITRTIPVCGTFTSRQKDIYTIVLNAQEKAIAAIQPGIEFRNIHRMACVSIMEGLNELGLVKGEANEAVNAGVHTLFFPCGLGHMLGLDVHDMEGLGEDFVGYTDTIQRNHQFGWRSLRLAKALEPGYVVTVEPGIYFIPALIDRCKAEGKYAPYVDYQRVESYRDFGGIRIEDDVLVTEMGPRILGPPIPKTIDEVEAACSY